jgi:hypothetical protein
LRPVTLLSCFGAASRFKNKTIKTVICLCHRSIAFRLRKCYELSSVPTFFRGERADWARNPHLNLSRAVQVIDLLE